ncbi:hypothetical protein LTR70_010131 [Exophiala xenobiotica]|uniref:Uncharacterized protein n=1 Tax=Lithohypha guttulata TaxID=1690604 RepID=A0ABR0JV19_9EURO|nr:hypothetical protein LTR24_010080 [Lithohypha guttulata]KAK5309609.1 hypothetical protein LTR70_010131 [Exophiala xenobiotica]
MATTMEALIAAAFCDGGEDALEKLLGTLGLDHEYLKQGRPSSSRRGQAIAVITAVHVLFPEAVLGL